ncbi:MAG: protein kinase, partial [Dokdonella sp.]
MVEALVSGIERFIRRSGGRHRSVRQQRRRGALPWAAAYTAWCERDTDTGHSMHASDRSGDAATQALPPLPIGAADEADLAPGTRIGPHRVEARLGRGGMGDVYLATQLQPVQRKVALKLIRAQAASPLARAYFEVERQALAQMQHPGIARVFDAGTTDDGHPYFAMEFVEGVPLTQYCRDH